MYFIGTTDIANRRVGYIDYALRRRFAFIDVLLNTDVIENPIVKKYSTSCKNYSIQILPPILSNRMFASVKVILL